MKTKTLRRRLGSGLALLVLLPVWASAQTPREMSLEKVKREIAILGIGEKAGATITLKDRSKIRGYISAAGLEDFVIRERATGNSNTVRYLDVMRIERTRTHSLAKGVAIGAVAGAGAMVAIVLGLWLHNER
jgi:hypothetical protein